jgi:uncharacterized protein YjiS (DUF1127 family)
LAHAIFTGSRLKRGSRIGFFCALARSAILRCRTLIAAWQRRRRDRQWLAQLVERALRDLGVDPSMVEMQSAVPFWQLQSSSRSVI